MFPVVSVAGAAHLCVMLHKMKLLLITCILSALLSATAYGEQSNFNLQEVGVRTVKDYLNLCQTLINEEKNNINSEFRKSSCLAYMRGLLDGYMGTLSIRAEYDIAKEKGISSKDLVERIEKDHTLHDQVTESKFKKYFLCYGSEYLYDLTVKLTKHVKKLEIDFDKANANYILLSELKKLYPCPDKINHEKKQSGTDHD